jgi:hypothetical protein
VLDIKLHYITLSDVRWMVFFFSLFLKCTESRYVIIIDITTTWFYWTWLRSSKKYKFKWQNNSEYLCRACVVMYGYFDQYFLLKEKTNSVCWYESKWWLLVVKYCAVSNWYSCCIISPDTRMLVTICAWVCNNYYMFFFYFYFLSGTTFELKFYIWDNIAIY